MCTALHASASEDKETHFYTDYITYSSMSAFSPTRICTFLFSLAQLWSKTDVSCAPPCFTLFTPGSFDFLHPGALIQLVGFYVSIVHCGIMLSDLLHVKSLLKFPLSLLFFPLLWEPENPFHVKIAACLWTHWLIGMWFSTECKFAIFFFKKIVLLPPSSA